MSSSDTFFYHKRRDVAQFRSEVITSSPKKENPKKKPPKQEGKVQGKRGGKSNRKGRSD